MSKLSLFWYGMGGPLRRQLNECVLYIKIDAGHACGAVERLVITIGLFRDK